MAAQHDLYDLLGIERSASAAEIKRSYRTLRTKAHPDKGGDPEAFHALTQAYEVLSDPSKRSYYDATGLVRRNPDEEFIDSFAGGAFSDPVRRASARRAVAESSSVSMKEQLVLHPGQTQPLSHTAGFEAWMRARGAGGAEVFTPDTIAEQFGVVRSSYSGVALRPRQVLAVVCRGAGKPQQQLQLVSQALPPELEWGQVLLEVLAAPINPADLYSATLGGIYGEECLEPPYVMGHDGVGVVTKVGPGVKELSEGDVVLTQHALIGTWREAAVLPAKHLLKVGRRPPSSAGTSSSKGDTAAAFGGAAKKGAGSISGAGAVPTMESAAAAGVSQATSEEALPLPLEYLAVARQLLLAYQLLAEHGSLKPGNAVVMNAPNSTVGRTLLQLCRLLKLRAIALLRPPAKGSTAADRAWEVVAGRLRELGATLVLRDEGTIKPQMDAQRFFARPKLALDAVGGASAARLAEALEAGGQLVVYGCLSGTPPTWPWQAWVFKGLKVAGYHLPWQLPSKASAAASKQVQVLQQLGKLVAAGLLSLDFTMYDLAAGVEGGAVPVLLPGAKEVPQMPGGGVGVDGAGPTGEEQEWYEAMQHVLDGPCGGSKVLLRMNQ